MSIRSIDRVIHDSSHLDNKLFIISMLLACNKHIVKCAFFPHHPMPLGCGGTAGREVSLSLRPKGPSAPSIRKFATPRYQSTIDFKRDCVRAKSS